jgi:hypothetical protein
MTEKEQRLNLLKNNLVYLEGLVSQEENEENTHDLEERIEEIQGEIEELEEELGE